MQLRRPPPGAGGNWRSGSGWAGGAWPWRAGPLPALHGPFQSMSLAPALMNTAPHTAPARPTPGVDN